MRDWTLARVIWVADRGFTSADNRRVLQQGGGGYIIGEKLRSGSAEAKAALSRQGRYQQSPGQPAGQGSPPRRRRRPVRHLLQPRPGRPRRRHPRPDARAAQGDDRRHRRSRDEAGRAARDDLHQAGPEPVPARHPRRPAPHRQGEDQGRGEPRRQVPAALLRPAPVRRGHRRWATSSSWRSNAAGAT